MKKILLLTAVLSAMAVTGCKKQITTPNVEPPVGSSDKMIYLGTVGPALGKAGNIGVRDSLFLEGDQIGVIAALSTTNVADWTKAAYFDNAPAIFSHNADVNMEVTPGGDTYGDARSYFTWGPKGEGGLTWNRYYPAQDKPIMVYAYYPYSTTNYIAPDGTATKPALNIALNTLPVRLSTPLDSGANLKQSDVLWFASAEEVNRTDTIQTMGFKHALSQLTFRFLRPAGSSQVYIDSVIFETLGGAVLDITTGDFTFPAKGTEDPDEVYTAAKYIITTDVNHRKVPVVSDPDVDPMLDIFTNTSPLMIFPLTADDAKLGRLRIVYNISPAGDKKGEEYVKSSVISLTSLDKAFLAGKKNAFNISINNTEIKLEAKIAPWGQDGSESDLEAD